MAVRNPFDQFDHHPVENAPTGQRSPFDPARLQPAQPQPVPQQQSPQGSNPFDAIDQQPQGTPETANAGTFDDGFNTPEQPHTQLAPEDEATLHGLFLKGTANEITQFLAAHQMQATRSVDDYVKERDKALAHGVGPEAGVVYDFPDMRNDPAANAGDTGVRGVVNSLTLGAGNKAKAAVSALGLGEGEDPGGATISDRYNRALDRQNGLDQYDHREHPLVRLGGELAGGLLLPVGIEGVGVKAGTEALRAGATMQEARTAAAAAVRSRLATVGGGYGVGHGVLSADDPAHALTGGLTEGALGTATGGILGHLGVIRANAPRTPPTAAVVPTDYRALADSLGVKPMPATVGGTSAEVTQMTLGNLPGGMNAISDAAKIENAGLEDAARRTATGIGTVSTRAGAGEAVAQGAGQYARNSKREATNLYNTRDQLMGGTSAPVDPANLRAAYADVARDFPTSQALAALNEHPVLRRLATALPDNGPITLGEATDALSHVRGVLRNLAAKSDASGPVLARVGKIEQALEDDVMATARNVDIAAGKVPGAPYSATEAQIRADAFYADRKAALNGSLKAPYKSSRDPIAMSGETVYNRLYGDTQRVGGNIARLRDTWFRLPDAARATFAATALDDLGRATSSSQNATGSAWSFETFLTNLDKMSPQARNIMFGTRANEEVRDIAAYASRIRDIGKSRNFSNTAKNMIAGGIATTVAGALLHGNFIVAGGEALLPAASYAGAKLFLGTPAMRQWTRAALRMGTANPVQAAATTRPLIARLSQVARANPQIANEVWQLQQHLERAFSSSPSRLAAQQPANESGEAQGNQGSNQNAQPDGPQP